MRLGYFPGCSLTGTAREYDLSLHAVMNRLDVRLEEIEDWSCCGASSAHSSNHMLALALPARNFALAHAQGFEAIVAPCAACYNRLVCTKHALESDPAVHEKVAETLGEEFSHDASVMNIIQLFQHLGTEKLEALRVRSLEGLHAACYYGCLLLRPADIVRFDDPESPSSMETLLKSVGVSSVDWNFGTECCGAAHSIARTDIVLDLSSRIIEDARMHGANVIVVACPMCQSNLDMRQRAMQPHDGGAADIPILYLS
ncbi:MAG: CoB--CoM heterodisulfide reductase iron-sulfur subunit B family protein, partial [Bacteroidota bacterium]